MLHNEVSITALRKKIVVRSTEGSILSDGVLALSKKLAHPYRSLTYRKDRFFCPSLTLVSLSVCVLEAGFLCSL